MPRNKHKPIHPGEVLLLEFMEPLEISAYRLAKDTGISAQQIGRIVKGERPVSAETALRLARFLGTTPEFWVNLQARYDLERAKDTAGREIKAKVKPYEAA